MKNIILALFIVMLMGWVPYADYLYNLSPVEKYSEYAFTFGWGFRFGGGSGPAVPPTGSFLVLENGDNLLLESGDSFLTE